MHCEEIDGSHWPRLGPRDGTIMNEQQLIHVFEICDVGWVFAEAATERAREIFDAMREVEGTYARAFGRPLGSLDQLILGDVTRFKPFVQAFASPMSGAIRTMAFCVLDGAQVAAISFDYTLKHRAHLEIEVRYDSGEVARFASDNVWDVEALRHFGLMKMGDAPVIDGYYAFRGAK